MAQQVLEGHQPASWEDAITAVANANGVSPLLAIAVAKRESGLNPDASGDGDLEGGPSRGLFQLRPATAQMLGVDPADPLQNITGGVKYLKQLSDRFGGDVSKALMAYNGGPEHIEKGDVSPAAQSYAAEVIASLSQGIRETTPVAPASSHTLADADFSQFGPMSDVMRLQAQGGDPASKEVIHGLDPRTPGGRENLAGMAGAAALTYATGSLATMPGVLPWIARVIGPAIGAATGGATEAAVEQTAGTAPPDPNAVVKAGSGQAALELTGQAAMWLPRHIMKLAAGTRLARPMKGFFEGEKAALKTETREGMAAARDTAEAGVAAAKSQAADFVSDVKRAGLESVRATHGRTAADLADIELRTTKDIGDAQAAYDAILKQPPSVTEAGQATREALAGIPPNHVAAGGTVGPAKKALDIAGQRVADVANQPGSFDSTPIRDSLMSMIREAYPQSVMPKPRQVGFGSLADVRANQGAIGGATAGDMSALQKAIQKSLGASEGQEVAHPIKGVLERVIGLPKQISYADAQALKQLLDEAVNFDSPAKKVVERMTKGVRKTLRESMSQIPGYDEATASYARMASLYRKGVGKKLIKDAAENPDRVAKILNPDQPQNAAKIRDLLVTQGEAGGDVQKGLAAWNAIRSAFTYENVFQGGVEDLSKRVHALVETQPEFAQVVFGDDIGKQILSNLDKIGMAYTEAAAKGVEETTARKAIGEASAAEVGEVGKFSEATARNSIQSLIDRAKALGKTDVRNAIQGYMDRKEALKGAETTFKDSSLGRFAKARSTDQALSDAVRIMMPRTLNRALAMVRFLEGPTAKDLLYYSALSDAGTQRVVNLLLNRSTDRAASAWVREMLPMIVGKPEPSHEPKE